MLSVGYVGIRFATRTLCLPLLSLRFLEIFVEFERKPIWLLVYIRRHRGVLPTGTGAALCVLIFIEANRFDFHKDWRCDTNMDMGDFHTLRGTSFVSEIILRSSMQQSRCSILNFVHDQVKIVRVSWMFSFNLIYCSFGSSSCINWRNWISSSAINALFLISIASKSLFAAQVTRLYNTRELGTCHIHSRYPIHRRATLFSCRIHSLAC